MARGKQRLAVGTKLPVRSEQIAVATDYLLSFGIPHDELLIAVVARIKLVDIQRLAGTTSRLAERYLTQTTYLTHNVRGVVRCYDIYLVVALVSHTKLTLRSEFALEQFLAYWCYYWLFLHCLIYENIL